MYLLTLFAVVLFGVCVNGITNYKHIIICEHESHKIKCDSNHVIDILEANYGRTSAATCKSDASYNLECYQEDSLSILSDTCEGKQHCKIEAKNEIFQDPCPGTVKYLFVLYRCLEATKYKSALSCENKPVKLKCEPGKVVQIVDANYGRRSKIICSDGPIKTTHCQSKNSADIVSNICRNRRECLVQASNYLFGDPCVGTLKYLNVKYKCVPEGNCSGTTNIIKNPENLFHCTNGSSINENLICNGFRDCPLGDDEFVCDYKSKFACEGRSMEIECNKNEIIKMIGSNYGRLSRKICPREKLDKKVDCKETHSVEVLRKKCDGKLKCAVKSENKVFGDPCENTYKYLEAHYDCIPAGEDTHKINPRSVS